jgi:hypothetical protein
VTSSSPDVATSRRPTEKSRGGRQPCRCVGSARVAAHAARVARAARAAARLAVAWGRQQLCRGGVCACMCCASPKHARTHLVLRAPRVQPRLQQVHRPHAWPAAHVAAHIAGRLVHREVDGRCCRCRAGARQHLAVDCDHVSCQVDLRLQPRGRGVCVGWAAARPRATLASSTHAPHDVNRTARSL